MQDIRNIFSSDPAVFLIFYCAYPLLNTLKVARFLKEFYPKDSHIIYYKKAFWLDEVKIDNGGERNLVEFTDNFCEDFSALKSTEGALIALADSVYLADSINTKGSTELDTPEKRAELTAFRDIFLSENPKVILKSMVN
jgi:hypothetical protein